MPRTSQRNAKPSTVTDFPMSHVTPSSSDNMLSVSNWKNTKAFKAIKDKETQIKYYARMNACSS
jgi:hypothetical protein